jgi:hypothetical protein
VVGRRRAPRSERPHAKRPPPRDVRAGGREPLAVGGYLNAIAIRLSYVGSVAVIVDVARFTTSRLRVVP